MKKSALPIGVFDSGVGGVSVLKELIKLMPNEKYIYFGDSANAPYGTKSHEQILALTERNVAAFVHRGVKAIVVACNTATSVCIDDLRKKYPDIPVVGIEPALKPAVESAVNPNVLVLATPLTLSEEKFSRLCKSYEDRARITLLPCPGLMELVERGVTQGEELENFLEKLFKGAGVKNADCVVLGCTHYPFVKGTVAKLLPGAKIFDGGAGTARQLKRLLEKEGLLCDGEGEVVFENSLPGEEITELSRRLLKYN